MKSATPDRRITLRGEILQGGSPRVFALAVLLATAGTEQVALADVTIGKNRYKSGRHPSCAGAGVAFFQPRFAG